MSAFVWLGSIATRVGRTRGACAWVFAALAFAVSGAAYGADQQHRLADRIEGSVGADDRQVHAEERRRPIRPRASRSPRRRVSRSTFSTPSNGLGTTQRAIDDVALRSVNVIQAGNRTRVVFNLNRPQTFETQVEGNNVLVTLFDQSEQLDAKAQVVQKFAEARPGRRPAHAARRRFPPRARRRGTHRRRSVRQRDGHRHPPAGQGADRRFRQDVAAAQPRAPSRRPGLRNADRSTSTRSRRARNVRMIVEPKGLWEHSAYQTDNRFILEVKPIVEDPNKLVQGSRQGYKGEKLSLNFQNVEVRAVLQVIADFTGLNIITSDSVSGSLTLRLKDIPWDQALDIIMQTKGLDMRKNGNVVLIAPREELALKEKQQLEAANEISELEPLRLRIVPAELHQGERHPEHRHVEPAAAVRPRRRADGDDRRTGLDHLEARRGVHRPALEHPVRPGYGGAARGGAQDHPADRHADPAGADRSAHRDRQRRVQQAARRALRRGDRVQDQQPVRGRPAGQPQHAAGRHAAGQLAPHLAARHADADALRACLRDRPCELLGFAGAQRQSAGDEPRRPARVDAHQPRQRQPDQSRALGARIRQPRQGRVEPARGDRRQPEGQHRAGYRDPVRDAGQREQSGDRASSRRPC